MKILSSFTEAGEDKDTGHKGFCELCDLQNAYCNSPENITLFPVIEQ